MHFQIALWKITLTVFNLAVSVHMHLVIF